MLPSSLTLCILTCTKAAAPPWRGSGRPPGLWKHIISFVRLFASVVIVLWKRRLCTQKVTSSVLDQTGERLRAQETVPSPLAGQLTGRLLHQPGVHCDQNSADLTQAGFVALKVSICMISVMVSKNMRGPWMQHSRQLHEEAGDAFIFIWDIARLAKEANSRCKDTSPA